MQCPGWYTRRRFGSAAPRLSSFLVHGEKAQDVVYGAGDVFSIRFDKGTDLGGTRGAKLYVDSLFAFSASIGSDYSGEYVYFLLIA